MEDEKWHADTEQNEDGEEIGLVQAMCLCGKAQIDRERGQIIAAF